jgi:hypothetical protein
MHKGTYRKEKQKKRQDNGILVKALVCFSIFTLKVIMTKKENSKAKNCTTPFCTYYLEKKTVFLAVVVALDFILFHVICCAITMENV